MSAATLPCDRIPVVRSRPVPLAAAPGERSLVDRIVAGDDRALAEVYDQYGALVHGVAVRLVGTAHAADVCQEVFVELWDRAERFDGDRGTLRAFLVTAARRRCIDHLRRHGRREANEERAAHARPVTVPDVGDSALALVAGARVRAALDRLPEAQREAIRLAYFDGLSFRAVAAATGVSEGTAKSRIRLGLGRLADALRDHEQVEPA